VLDLGSAAVLMCCFPLASCGATGISESRFIAVRYSSK
jgi:hypothetical protein